MRRAWAFSLGLLGVVAASCGEDDGTRSRITRPAGKGGTAGSRASGGTGGAQGQTGGTSGTSGSSAGNDAGGGGETGDSGNAVSGETGAGTGGRSAGGSAGEAAGGSSASGGTNAGRGGSSVATGGTTSPAGTGPDDAGAAGTPTLSCTLDQACCAEGMCNDGYACAGETCSCVRALNGSLYLRTDGKVVHYTTQNDTDLITVEATTTPLDGITEIYGTQSFGCGRRNDGTIWCWALGTSSNGSGELGMGMTTTSTVTRRAYQVVTTDLEPLTGVVHISDGGRCYTSSNTCAVTSGGSLYCWGVNVTGGGGGPLFTDGLAGDRPAATQILGAAASPLTGVEAVTNGGGHACVLKDGGQVWCWGSNVGGPLGNGTQTASLYPIQVSLPGPATRVSATSGSTCAVVGGSVYCWGSSGVGQLGIGDPTLPENNDGCINRCKMTPKIVIDGNGDPITGVTSLTVAYQGACVLGAQGMLCWGDGRAVATTVQVNSMPVTDVTMVTSCGSADIPGSLRFLTPDNRLFLSTQVVNQLCN